MAIYGGTYYRCDYYLAESGNVSLLGARNHGHAHYLLLFNKQDYEIVISHRSQWMKWEVKPPLINATGTLWILITISLNYLNQYKTHQIITIILQLLHLQTEIPVTNTINNKDRMFLWCSKNVSNYLLEYVYIC